MLVKTKYTQFEFLLLKPNNHFKSIYFDWIPKT